MRWCISRAPGHRSWHKRRWHGRAADRPCHRPTGGGRRRCSLASIDPLDIHDSCLLTSIAGARGLVAPFLGSALAALPWLGVNGVLLLAAALVAAGTVAVARTDAPPEPAPADELEGAMAAGD